MSKPLGLIAGAAFWLAGCGDPLRDVPRLSDVEVAGTAGEAQALPGPEESRPDGGFLADADARREAGADATEATSERPPQGGLLGFLRARAEAGKAAEAAPQAATAAEDGSVEIAAMPPASAPRRTRGGLFGGLLGGSGPPPGAPDYAQVGPGVTLPYGTLARLCGAPERLLGRKVATYPERGRARFTLYDTAPGTTAPHTFFVTGFDDGCARQFTAALAIFGSPVLHEQLRYGLPARVQPYSTTDEAYERVKSRVCRVGKGQPCGNAMRRLEPEMTFLAVYERFGSNPRWKTILLHDGSVVATDIKD